MPIKGFEEWLKYLPDFNRKRIKLLLIRFPLVTVLTLIILIIFDFIPRYMPDIDWLIIMEPFFPLISSILACVIGFRIVHKIWHERDELIEKYKEIAYQKSVKYVFTGIPIILAGLLHGFFPIVHLPFNIFPTPTPTNPLTSLFAKSMLQIMSSFIFGNVINDSLIRVFFVVLFLLFSILTVIRTINVFGIDYAALVYLYYPEESKVIKHEIYSIVRNPLYMGVTVLSLSVIFSRLSIYSLLIGLTFPLGLLHLINFVEDKELLERFGKEFQQFKKEVPALLIRPKNWGKYIKFVLMGKF